MQVDASVHAYIEEAKLLPDSEHSLYVGIKGGGCSGLQYVFEIVKFDPDKYISVDTYVATDKKSAMFLKDCILVYKESVGARILVVENAQAKNTCGCGLSFNL